MNSRILFFILLFVFSLRVLLAAYFPNILWADEVFQTLEQAHRLVFGYGEIPWEYRDGIRNWIFPGFLSAFIYLGSFIDYGSFGYVYLIYSVLTLLSLVPVYYVYTFCEEKYGKWEACLAALLVGLNSYLIFMAPKAFFEVVAAHLFIAVPFLLKKADTFKTKHFVAIGFLCGLTVSLRLHYLPAVGLVLLYFAWKLRMKFLPLAIGTLLTLLFAGILDLITWTYPFQSFWLYFYKNIIEGISKRFGVEVWYFYLKTYVYEMGFAFPFLLILAGIGAYFEPLLALIFLAVLIPHSMIGHKEYRFLYLGNLSFFMMCAIGSAFLMKRYFQARWFKALLVLSWLGTLIYLPFLNKDDYLNNREDILAYQSLSLDKEMCGLVTQHRIGGFYTLHKRIPVISLTPITPYLYTQRYNRVLCRHSEFDREAFVDYTVERCFKDLCVYKRPGNCGD